MPHHVKLYPRKAVFPMVEPSEGLVELLAEIFGKAGAETLDEAVSAAAPFAEDIDRVVELCGTNFWQEARLQRVVDEPFAGRGDPVFSSFDSPSPIACWCAIALRLPSPARPSRFTAVRDRPTRARTAGSRARIAREFRHATTHICLWSSDRRTRACSLRQLSARCLPSSPRRRRAAEPGLR